MLEVTSHFNAASEPAPAGIYDTLCSGNYHVTPEVGRQLVDLKSGIDHMRLDNQFLDSSKNWGNKFDFAALRNEKCGAAQSMPAVNTAVNNMRNETYTQAFKQLDGNTKGDIHYNAQHNLSGINKELSPYVHTSVDRIKQFCDHLGVTDRYTGYRHNLNRSRLNPSKVGHAWMDKSQPNTYNRSLNVGWAESSRPNSVPTYAGRQKHALLGSKSAPPQYRSGYVNPKQTLGTVQSMHARHNGVEFHTGPMTKSIQEQCGINMTFPGKTEYMDRYIKPMLNTKTSPFIVNPKLDLESHGRPMDRHGYIPKITEYQGRYVWPDGSKITKLPWLSK